MPSGTMRSGYGGHQSSKSQSFQASDGQAQLGVLASAKTRPQKPVIDEGKLTDAQTPLMSMSAIRASMS